MSGNADPDRKLFSSSINTMILSVFEKKKIENWTFTIVTTGIATFTECFLQVADGKHIPILFWA